MQSDVPKNEMFVFKNDARSLARYVALGGLCGSRSKIVDMLVNGGPSLFGSDSVHQMETFLSHALLVY
jgi:hypothetical protein